MSAFKKLNKSDTFIVPYTANKDWNLYYSSSFPFDDQIKIYKGTNYTGSFNFNGPVNQDNIHEKTVYDSINHLFYQKFTSNLNTHSLASSLYFLSASIYRPTSSYFNYDENPGIIKYFPTGSNQNILVISVNPSLYGNRIKPGTFSLNIPNNITITDDSNGNVYSNSSHVGNIFYNHGLVIITNNSIISSSFYEINPIAYSDNTSFDLDSNPKTIYPLLNDFSGSYPINTSSIELFNNPGVFYTSSNGTIICNAGSVGTYEVLYRFKNSQGVPSNKAKISSNIAFIPRDNIYAIFGSNPSIGLYKIISNIYVNGNPITTTTGSFSNPVEASGSTVLEVRGIADMGSNQTVTIDVLDGIAGALTIVKLTILDSDGNYHCQDFTSSIAVVESSFTFNNVAINNSTTVQVGFYTGECNPP